MEQLNDHIREYTARLREGHIQKAYKGIITFMTDLKAYLESGHPDFISSALYFGYMDMTYFAFTPAALKDIKLKIAVVYLHEECRFEVWLAANNRQTQAEYVKLLCLRNLGGYTLSQPGPGVDAIIASAVDGQPDFDNPEELKKQIEAKAIGFAKDVERILK